MTVSFLVNNGEIVQIRMEQKQIAASCPGNELESKNQVQIASAKQNRQFSKTVANNDIKKTVKVNTKQNTEFEISWKSECWSPDKNSKCKVSHSILFLSQEFSF